MNKVLQTTNTILNNSKVPLTLIACAILFFVIIRNGYVLYSYFERETLIQEDDTLSYMISAESLVKDPFMQSTSYTTYKDALHRDSDLKSTMIMKREHVVTVQYCILWSSVVAFLNHGIGLEYETIMWFLCFAGQICFLLAFLHILRSLEFTMNESALAIVLFSLTFTRVKEFIVMNPREWAAILFMFIMGYAFSVGKQHFSKWKMAVIVCLSICGALMHPRFMLLSSIVYLFLFFQFIKLANLRNDIIKLSIVMTLPMVLVVFVEKIIASYGFPFLGLSSNYSATRNLDTVSASLFFTNFKSATSLIMHYMDGFTIMVYDGFVWACVGLVCAYKYQKRLFLFAICLMIMSFMSLFLYYHYSYPAQYFRMFNTIIVVLIVLLVTKGFVFLFKALGKS